MANKLTIDQVAEALELQNSGVFIWAIAKLLHVHESTLRKTLRNAERYGFSYWSTQPTDQD